MKARAKWLAVILAAIILTVSFVAIYFAEQKLTNAFKIRVACVGDSITEGTNYPNDLSIMLGGNYTVGNFGVGGATASLESENPYMNHYEFQNAKDFEPNIVVILLGTNDAWPSREQNLNNFTVDYEKMVESFQALATKPKILLVIPPPIFSAALGPNNSLLLNAVIPRITQAATELNLPLVDTYTPLMHHGDYFGDGVHPNDNGAKIIAAEIYKALNEK